MLWHPKGVKMPTSGGNLKTPSNGKLLGSRTPVERSAWRAWHVHVVNNGTPVHSCLLKCDLQTIADRRDARAIVNVTLGQHQGPRQSHIWQVSC